MTVIEVANKYVGMKEKPGNVFDEKTILGQELRKAGQKDGEAWCAYFAEAVFCEAMPEKNEELRKLFSASAVQTYENFVKAGYDVHAVPLAGDLVIWQKYAKGVKTWQGHAGIVVEVDNRFFYTIEGNTNSEGSREGDSVQRKTRANTWKSDGLNIKGFITIQKQT